MQGSLSSRLRVKALAASEDSRQGSDCHLPTLCRLEEVMSWFARKRILVPFDFSDEAHQAVDTALEMAISGAEVQVIHVAADLAVASPEVVWETQTEGLRTQKITHRFREEFAADKYRDLEFSVGFGDPGHGITDHAEKMAADLIVMPSHGRTGIKRLLIGSVAERVVRLAHCPVLVLRK